MMDPARIGLECRIQLGLCGDVVVVIAILGVVVVDALLPLPVRGVCCCLGSPRPLL